MKKFQILLIIFFLIPCSSFAQDTSKVGISDGDVFTYEINNEISDTDIQIFRIQEDGETYYVQSGEEAEIEILQAPSDNNEIIFQMRSEDGTTNYRDDISVYGQPFLYTDWDYWASEVEDIMIFDDPAIANETTEALDNSTHFGTTTTAEQNITLGSTWSYIFFEMTFQYDKETGANTLFNITTHLEFSNGTREIENYSFTLVDTQLQEDTSGLNLFEIIIIIMVIGFIFFVGYNNFKDKSNDQGEQQIDQAAEQEYQSTDPPENQQISQQHQTEGPTKATGNTPNFCTYCGATLIVGDNFCTSCGEKIVRN